MIPKVIKEYRAHGGYLRRYRGGPLERFREPIDDGNRDDRLSMGLDEITALAFLQVRSLLRWSATRIDTVRLVGRQCCTGRPRFAQGRFSGNDRSAPFARHASFASVLSFLPTQSHHLTHRRHPRTPLLHFLRSRHHPHRKPPPRFARGEYQTPAERNGNCDGLVW